MAVQTGREPLVGQPIKRREDPRLIRGQATYVDDLKLPGMLHLAFKRSDVAHGTIVRIDTEAAAAMPGVELVVTGVDLLDTIAPYPTPTPLPRPDQRVVAVDKVRYVGEALAVVVATDRYLARDAVDAIIVEIEDLPAVVDPERAMSDESVLLHDDFANNLAAALISGGTGVDRASGTVDDSAIDAAFERADVIVSQRMVSQRLAPMCMEPRGVLASWDAGAQQMTHWSSTQTPHRLKLSVAGQIGLAEQQFRAIAPEVGGGFGAKKFYGEDAVAAALSMRLGRPVKWIQDRSEAFMSTIHGRGLTAYLDIAAKRDGSVLGLKVRIIADIGAYQMLGTAIVPTLTQTMISNVYAFPAIRTTLTEVFTNKIPTDAYRGAGRPEGVYFTERAMDMLARELDMDPIELRRKNFIQPEQFPFLTQTGATYDVGEYEQLLDKTLELSDWERLKAERDEARSQGRLVGLGVAYYTELCGVGPSGRRGGSWEYGAVTVERSGVVTAISGASSHGQGHETTFAQMLADVFSIPMDDITILQGDTAVVRHGIGTFGSRSQLIGGTVLRNAALKVKSKMVRFAAQMLEAREQDIVVGEGRFFVAGAADGALSFAEVAAYAYIPTTLPRDTEPGLSEEAFWTPQGSTFPYGCYITQVEVDRNTGEIELQKLIGVDDCGVIINPLIVAGQLHGGLAQGIGQAMLEEVVYDDDGQLITGSLMDYAIPRARDLPRFELGETVTPTPISPIGAKGVGEAGTIGSSPSVVSAVVDALSEFDVKHIDMMLRPEKLWRIIHGVSE